MEKKPLIIIMGPTGSGKTRLSIKIAKKVGGEIISADSRQVYKDMSLLSEKISKEDMEGIPHHCIDIVSPKRSFSVFQWKKRAEKALTKIYKKNKIPILVGGSVFYIQTLLFNENFPSAPPKNILRKKYEKKSTKELYSLLLQKDPLRAQNIEKENPRRLIRALEIIEEKGCVPPLLKKEILFTPFFVGIMPPFPLIEKNIKERLEISLKKGLIEEALFLSEKYSLSEKRIKELGLEYRIIHSYLKNEIKREDLFQKLYEGVRRYAKKQKVWLQKYESVEWKENEKDAFKYFLTSHFVHSQE
jgi:tRNA dimethylallyltransferase